MIRTPKEWDEQCRECGGRGTVHKKEHFSLWTPEELKGMGANFIPQKLDAKYDVPANAVVCVTHAGASILEACKEGVTLARAYGRPVAFEFNDTIAICHASSDPSKVAEEWWKRAFGETQEETLARR